MKCRFKTLSQWKNYTKGSSRLSDVSNARIKSSYTLHFSDLRVLQVTVYSVEPVHPTWPTFPLRQVLDKTNLPFPQVFVQGVDGFHGLHLGHGFSLQTFKINIVSFSAEKPFEALNIFHCKYSGKTIRDLLPAHG